MANYFLSVSQRYKEKTSPELYRRREVVCSYLGHDYLIGEYTDTETYKLVQRELEQEGIEINESIYKLDKKFLRTIYLWVLNTPKPDIFNPDLLPKHGLSGARCLLDDCLVQWQGDTVVRLEPPVEQNPFQNDIVEVKKEQEKTSTVLEPKDEVKLLQNIEPVKSVTNTVHSENKVVSGTPPQKAVLVKKQDIPSKYPNLGKPSSVVVGQNNTPNTVIRKLHPPAPKHTFFGEALRQATQSPVVVTKPKSSSEVLGGNSLTSNTASDKVESQPSISTEFSFDAGLRKLISAFQSETARLAKEFKQIQSDAEHFKTERDEALELFRLSELEKSKTLPQSPETLGYISLLEHEVANLEQEIRLLKEQLDSKDRLEIEKLAKQYPQFPALFSVAQELKLLTSDKHGKYRELVNKLPKNYRWGSSTGDVLYRRPFLKDLVNFEKKEQDNVVNQIVLLTTQGPEIPSLNTTKYLAQLPHSPTGCLVSRAGELRFSWKRNENLVLYGVFRVSDTRLKNQES
jgi:hypothetical protein